MNDTKPPEQKGKIAMLDYDPSTNSQDIISQVLSTLKKQRDLEVIKLSFDTDPKKPGGYQNVYKPRTTLIPNSILKRVRDTEELIGGIILPARKFQISLFSRPRANRFDIGFAINFKPEMYTKFNDEQRQKLKDDVIPKLKEILLNCGYNSNLQNRDKKTLSQFFMEIVEDLLTFGWFTTEVRKDEAGKFHSFRAVDAGTIYFATKQQGADKDAQNVRDRSKTLLEKINDLKINISKFHEDKYTWVQAVDEQPVQVFTDEELVAWSLHPSTDITRSGYPISPIERILSSITTHINLTTHNKMYFLNGKAARNVMVFQSENLEQEDISAIRAQMQAHINSSNSAWRMPVFGIGEKDKITIQPLEAGGRDMEFQYLADLNKRMIFGAYQMSPDEVAALAYLSRGTNSQALSEANNEYKLIAARDIGLRPILLSIEDFLNERLLPLISTEWAKMFSINLEGIDADTPEKEATRLEQDAALFLTMNDIMDRVEKEKVKIGGDFPLNSEFLQILERYFTKGEILESFGGEQYKGASKNADLQYYMGDPVWLQLQQLKMQQQQMAAQAQAQQAQPGQPQPEQEPSPAQQEAQQTHQDVAQGQDLDSAVAQLTDMLSKSESSLPVNRREMLKKHKAIKKQIMDSWKKESSDMIEKLLNSVGEDDHDHD